jgi:hypothetical protein
MATAKDAPQTLDQPNDDQWTVPKLIGLIILTLGAFFVFIYNVSPFYDAGPVAPSEPPAQGR